MILRVLLEGLFEWIGKTSKLLFKNFMEYFGYIVIILPALIFAVLAFYFGIKIASIITGVLIIFTSILFGDAAIMVDLINVILIVLLLIIADLNAEEKSIVIGSVNISGKDIKTGAISVSIDGEKQTLKTEHQIGDINLVKYTKKLGFFKNEDVTKYYLDYNRDIIDTKKIEEKTIKPVGDIDAN